MSTDVEGYYADSEDEGSWDLVLAFDTTDPEFTRGFTCGMIWQLMELECPLIQVSVTSDNLLMCWEMATARDYALSAEETGVKASGLCDTDWVALTFTKETVDG